MQRRIVLTIIASLMLTLVSCGGGGSGGGGQPSDMHDVQYVVSSNKQHANITYLDENGDYWYVTDADTTTYWTHSFTAVNGTHLELKATLLHDSMNDADTIQVLIYVDGEQRKMSSSYGSTSPPSSVRTRR